MIFIDSNKFLEKICEYSKTCEKTGENGIYFKTLIEELKQCEGIEYDLSFYLLQTIVKTTTKKVKKFTNSKNHEKNLLKIIDNLKI